jgi:hypothetical protein
MTFIAALFRRPILARSLARVPLLQSWTIVKDGSAQDIGSELLRQTNGTKSCTAACFALQITGHAITSVRA